MINVEFTIDEKDYQIDGITIADWYKVKDYMLVDGQEASFKVVSELSGCPVEMLKKLKTHEWLKLWTTVEQYSLTINNGQLEKLFEIEGKLYGLVHMDQLTIGEFADMDVLMNDPLKETKLHQMMAILYRPVVKHDDKHYEIEDYDPTRSSRRAEEFLKVPVAICLGLISFFLDFAKASYNLIVDSLRKKVSQATKEDKNLQSTLEKLISSLPEVGTTASSDFQELTLSNLKKLQDSLSTQL